MIETFVLFFVFLIILIKASHLTIDQAVKISEHMSTTHFAVGFVLIAVATSLPELFISALSSLTDHGQIAIGNIIGSNIANVTIVLGIISFFGIIKIARREMIENVEILLFISFFPVYLLIKESIGTVSGILLISTFFVYCMYLFKREGAAAVHYILDVKTKKFIEYRKKKSRNEVLKIYLLFFIGVALTIICAHFIIQYAIEIINFFTIPPSFMGVTLIAVGTSLPELAIGITAIKKRYSSLALGNIVGSCVVNLTLVLGAASILSPVRMKFDLFTSALTFLVLANVVLLYSLARFDGIPRKAGFFLIILYFLFIVSEVGILVLQ